MRRAGRTNRRRARALTREAVFSWAFVKLVLLCTGGMAALFGFWLLISTLVSDEVPPRTVMWFMAGAAAASIPWATAFVVFSVDGSFYWRLGADGEEYTGRELARLGTAWTVRHSIPFATPSGGEVDVDHVAIGPHGVLVVESKLRTSRLDLNEDPIPWKVRDAAEQARRNVTRVRGLLGPEFEVELIPLVVYWGRAVARPSGGVRRIGNVRVVRGQDGEEWRGRLTGTRISPDQRDAMVARLDQAVTEHEQAARSR